VGTCGQREILSTLLRQRSSKRRKGRKEKGAAHLQHKPPCINIQGKSLLDLSVRRLRFRRMLRRRRCTCGYRSIRLLRSADLGHRLLFLLLQLPLKLPRRTFLLSELRRGQQTQSACKYAARMALHLFHPASRHAGNGENMQRQN